MHPSSVSLPSAMPDLGVRRRGPGDKGWGRKNGKRGVGGGDGEGESGVGGRVREREGESEVFIHLHAQSPALWQPLLGLDNRRLKD